MFIKRFKFILSLVVLYVLATHSIYANSVLYPPVYDFDLFGAIICVVVVALTCVCASYILKVIKKNDNDSKQNSDKSENKE